MSTHVGAAHARLYLGASRLHFGCTSAHRIAHPSPLGLQVIPSSCYDRTATNSHLIYTLPLTLRLFNPTMLHVTLESDSQILVRRD
mmetsp:Transcript_35707/g.112167  ORF Transcript_35707/g.112167 Transcript_35707/m.112167 type:complete len:86 (-) Transcript_35707:238-495(-)